MIVTTSDQERAGTDAPVTLTVFGDKGDTGPLPLEGDGKFQRGAADDFQVFIYIYIYLSNVKQSLITQALTFISSSSAMSYFFPDLHR